MSFKNDDYLCVSQIWNTNYKLVISDMSESLTYIWHDCFIFENENVILIFDFWKLPDYLQNKNDNEIPAFLFDLDKTKHLYVFVSHHHKDHYNPSIFKWEKFFLNITFIISKDTSKHARYILSETSFYNGYKPKLSNVKIINRGEQYSDTRIKVTAFSSTDIGNSYLIESDGKKIFHAGDLNAWLWKDESSEEEINEALTGFNKILNEIYEFSPRIDFAMFPVDSRIGTDFFTGARLFVRKINVRYFFPMHFTLGETVEEKVRLLKDACEVKNYANPERGEYICLTSPFSKFYVVQSGHRPDNT